MKRMFFLLLMAMATYNSAAQEIIVNAYENGGNKGYKITLESKPEKVESFISTYFKLTGKVRLRSGVFTITGLSRADFPFPEVVVYSSATPLNGRTVANVWIADSLMEDEGYSVKLKELWYNFGVDFYRFLVQEEIDESTRALEFAQKQYQRLEKDSINLKNDVQNNRNERVKLEEALKTNDLNYKVLLQKIENNAYAQDSVLIAIDKIRHLLEIQKQKKQDIQ